MHALIMMGVESLYKIPHSNEWDDCGLKWPTADTFGKLTDAG